MDGDAPATLEIRVRGTVPRVQADRLGLIAEVVPATTALRGSFVDRPALHGALERILTDGLELVEVRRVPR